jgi:hypothetical protein
VGNFDLDRAVLFSPFANLVHQKEDDGVDGQQLFGVLISGCDVMREDGAVVCDF